LIHSGHPLLSNTGELAVSIALRTQDGHLLDRSLGYVAEEVQGQTLAMQCFRYIDCEMFYDDTQLMLLLRATQANRPIIRQAFFENLLRCRRRDRRRWNDTPLAKV
jgi:hypothetical protein